MSEIQEPYFNFETKDSGKRQEYDSGMVRDTQEGKPRFDLLFPKGIPYRQQPLYRVAMLMARGVEKYGERNWEKAALEEEYDRFGGSGLRHNIQDYCGETDEDHPAAVAFNAIARMSLQAKGYEVRDDDAS